MKQIQTNSFEETQKIGQAFAADVKGGDVVCLKGDLGAGKTTFMQGLAKGLGIERRIISPTFIIMRTYEITKTVSPIVIARHVMTKQSSEIATSSRSIDSPRNDEIKTIKRLYHIDLYRTENLADLEGLGIPEILQEKDAIVAIEWSEKLGSLLPKKRWELEFEWIDENTRKIKINKFSI